MGTRWRGMLAPINTPTGDGRRIMTGGFTHRPLPLPLKWQRSDTQGHDDSVVIGSMDKIEIGDDAVWGEGELFDDVNPATNPRLAEDVAEAKLLSAKKVIGPSVDPGSAKGMTVLQGQDTPLTDAKFEQAWMLNPGDPPPTEMLFTDYEIAAATLVPIPAFAECRPFELLGAAPSTLTAAARDALLADQLVMPDLELFGDPKLAQVTPLTRRELPNGWTRIFGHIATHDVCHVGIRNTCTTAPYSELNYREFHRYEATDDGSIEFPVAVGRLTAAYGELSDACRCCVGNDDHACDQLSLGAAIAHHDLMDVLAYGCVGEDDANNAIWFSGIEAPGIGQAGVALLSRQKVSGDWRPFAGGLELAEVLVLSHRNPGFPLPRVAMRGGRQSALVAAGTVRPDRNEDGMEAFDPGLDRVSQLFAELGEALGEFGFNEHQRRGPDGKWIKMGGPGSAKPSLHVNSPEVKAAREKLRNAETMHGPDRSKWSKKDQRAAKKLDQIVNGAIHPPTTLAKPKVAETDDRDAYNTSYLDAATQMFDQFVENEGGWDTAYEGGPLGDVRDALDEANDLLNSGDANQRDEAIDDLRKTVETYYPNEISLPDRTPGTRPPEADAPGVNPSGMPGSPAAEHAAARAAGVTPADRLRYNREVVAAAHRVNDAQVRKGNSDTGLVNAMPRGGLNGDIPGAQQDAAVDRLRQYLETNHGGNSKVKGLRERVPSPGDATPDEVLAAARQAAAAEVGNGPNARHTREIVDRIEKAVASGDLKTARYLASTMMLQNGVTAAARTEGWSSMPLASDDRTWDAGAAKARLDEWAGDDISGKYAHAFLWHDGDPDLKGSYKLPIADVIGGELTVVPAGVRAAASYLPKTDGISPAEQGRIRGVLDDLLDRIHGDDGEAVTAAAPEGGHAGAMVALRMTEQDAARLCATDGLPMDQLHTTFCYLGDSDQIDQPTRERILSDMREYAASQPGPIQADGFALNAFNPGNMNDRDTAIVLGVGGQELADAHAMASEVWGGWSGEDGTWMVPEQHSPWVPHVTLQYTDDLNAVKKLADRVGPLSFDRLRVAFGADVVDIPLGAPNTGGEQIPADEARMSADSQACDSCGKFDACATCTDCGGAPTLSSRAEQALMSLRLAEANLLLTK